VTAAGAKRRVARLLAQACVALPPLERGLRHVCRDARLRRWTRAGAVAVAYPEVLTHERVEVAELDGFRLQVNLAEHQGAGAYFLGETVVPAWLPRLLRPGDACLDVGANAGVFALSLAQGVGPGGRVVAFEPNPALAGRFLASVALNPRLETTLELDTRAVADVDGAQVTFYPSLDPHNSGTSSLVRGAHGTTEAHALQVETTTLDSAASARGISAVRFCKVDVEGVEERVLRGAAGLLARQAVDLWFIEMRRGEPPEGQLLEAGYAGFGVRGRGGGLVPLDEVPRGEFGDLLFASPAVLPALRAAAADVT